LSPEKAKRKTENWLLHQHPGHERSVSPFGKGGPPPKDGNYKEDTYNDMDSRCNPRNWNMVTRIARPEVDSPGKPTLPITGQGPGRCHLSLSTWIISRQFVHLSRLVKAWQAPKT
jgi:hypothetical protein